MVEIVENDVVDYLIGEWQQTRGLTLDFIEKTSLENLNKKLSRPGLDTLAKHIKELALVQKAYIDVLEGGELDFSEVESITTGEEDYKPESKEKLIEELNKVDEKFKEVLNKTENWREEVKVFRKEVPKYTLLELMIRHESLHHGQIIAFGYSMGIEFPESMVKAWALP